LLQEIGQDCVGALQLLPEGASAPDVRCITCEPLDTNEIERLPGSSSGTSFVGDFEDDFFRISLAGAQEKTAFFWHNESWHRPVYATPITHIFKLPQGLTPQGIDLSTSVENEWLCAQILREYGIEVASCRMEVFGNYKLMLRGVIESGGTRRRGALHVRPLTLMNNGASSSEHANGRTKQ
jgi:serine/threonine-protein kinase HipA